VIKVSFLKRSGLWSGEDCASVLAFVIDSNSFDS